MMTDENEIKQTKHSSFTSDQVWVGSRVKSWVNGSELKSFYGWICFLSESYVDPAWWLLNWCMQVLFRYQNQVSWPNCTSGPTCTTGPHSSFWIARTSKKGQDDWIIHKISLVYIRLFDLQLLDTVKRSLVLKLKFLPIMCWILIQHQSI